MNIAEYIPFLPLLYAEMHYTLHGFSLVYRSWPEIVADVPYRLEPGCPLPVLLLLKDADRFPVFLHTVTVEITYSDGTGETHTLIQNPVFIENASWHRIFHIRVLRKNPGPAQVLVKIEAGKKHKKRLRTFYNDNYRGMSHVPFTVHLASQPFPLLKNYISGDIHFHSDFTHDQAEFGAPLDATVEMAGAIGIRFSAVTDHSYDLDDMPDNYLKNDTRLAKWKKYIKETDRLSTFKEHILIRGEEITAGNLMNRNVHLLVLNTGTYYPGAGDSAEKWFRTRPDLSISEILDNLEPDALAFAAHPEDAFNFLHRKLLRRDKWQKNDYNHARLNGLQIWNGPHDKTFLKGLKSWIHLLLEGQKISIVAGNDAHGNFNRFRQLLLPFLLFTEKEDFIYGKSRTVVYIEGKPTLTKILNALASGHSYVSNGPALSIRVINRNGQSFHMGQTVKGKPVRLVIQGLSTEEFGPFQSAVIRFGSTGWKAEKTITEIIRFNDPFQFDQTIELTDISSGSYIRAEITTHHKEIIRALTNPIYFGSTGS